MPRSQLLDSHSHSFTSVIACNIRYPIRTCMSIEYSYLRHTHQSARLRTIIYNVICNLFIDPILVLLESTKLLHACRIDRTFVLCMKAYRFNIFQCSDVHRFPNTKLCIRGSCYSCGIKCIFCVSISHTHTLPPLLLSFWYALWL